jgi:KUP system potassium uptake protein
LPQGWRLWRCCRVYGRLDIETLLKTHGIREKVIFYGIEDINTRNPVWKVFSLLKKLTPNFVQSTSSPRAGCTGW